MRGLLVLCALAACSSDPIVFGPPVRDGVDTYLLVIFEGDSTRAHVLAADAPFSVKTEDLDGLSIEAFGYPASTGLTPGPFAVSTTGVSLPTPRAFFASDLGVPGCTLVDRPSDRAAALKAPRNDTCRGVEARTEKLETTDYSGIRASLELEPGRAAGDLGERLVPRHRRRDDARPEAGGERRVGRRRSRGHRVRRDRSRDVRDEERRGDARLDVPRPDRALRDGRAAARRRVPHRHARPLLPHAVEHHHPPPSVRVPERAHTRPGAGDRRSRGRRRGHRSDADRVDALDRIRAFTLPIPSEGVVSLAQYGDYGFVVGTNQGLLRAQSLAFEELPDPLGQMPRGNTIRALRVIGDRLYFGGNRGVFAEVTPSGLICTPSDKASSGIRFLSSLGDEILAAGVVLDVAPMDVNLTRFRITP